MIHHISLDVDEPAFAAGVLAEIFDGAVIEGLD